MSTAGVNERISNDRRKNVARSIYANLVRSTVLLVIAVEIGAYFPEVLIDLIERRRFANPAQPRLLDQLILRGPSLSRNRLPRLVDLPNSLR